MDLTWDTEQIELRDTLRSFFGASGSGSGLAPEQRGDLLAGLGDLGVIGLSVPEELGGAGAGLITDSLFFEELGRALVGGPVFPVAALAAPLLCASTRVGDIAPHVLDGGAVAVAWAGSESEHHLQSAGSPLAVEDCSAPSTIASGTLPLVHCATGADLLIVIVGGADANAYLVDPRHRGVEVTARASLDPSTPLADVTLRRAPAIALFDGVTAAAAVEDVLRRAVLLAGAECVGVAQAVLALSREHVSVRSQFGRPIGTYQAVSHPLVNVYADIELTRSLGLIAAHALERRDDVAAALLAGYALSAASLGTRACEVAIQVHGGLGMTWESALHRFYKRAKVLSALIGPASVHRAAVVSHLSGARG